MENTEYTFKQAVKDFIITFLEAAVPAFLILHFVIANSVVPTGSMEPIIPEHSRIIGNRLAYRFGNDPKRGDVVIFRFPDNERVFFVKRIIGTPGDTVEIVPYDDDSGYGNVLVNGHPIYEPYLKEPMYVSRYQKFEVPEDSYFMMGDNRNDSEDARYWEHTYVKRDKIAAKVLFKYWKGFAKIR